MVENETTSENKIKGIRGDFSNFRSSSTLNNKFYKHFTKAAVSTDIPVCSTVGKDILTQNGSAVDSAIAAMLCVGIINFQATGKCMEMIAMM